MDGIEVIKYTSRDSENEDKEFRKEYVSKIDEYNAIFVNLRTIIYDSHYKENNEIATILNFFNVDEAWKISLSDTLENFIKPLIKVAQKYQYDSLLKELPNALVIIQIIIELRKSCATKIDNDIENLNRTSTYFQKLIETQKKLFKNEKR